MTETEKKTHWKGLTNPNYLGAYSLQPKEERVLTIDYVMKEIIKGEKGREDGVTVAYFKEKSKPMILNKTNCKVIEKLVGTPYIEDWPGLSITIFTANVKFGKEWVEALRIRENPEVKKLPELSPESKYWEGAKKAIGTGDIVVEDILNKFSITEANQVLLCEK